MPTEKIFRCGTLSYTKRGLIALFAWMLWGDFCFTLMETVVPSILPLKLRSLDSPNILIGFIMTTLPGIFNVSVTPWLSFKSDRFRSRWGRRLPFILYTMPFLTISLIAIGFSSEIGAWVHGHLFSGSSIRQAQVVIVLLAVFAASFDLFNMFVNTVYWYLFNDIVPEEWMGRFMGWFRLVGVLTSAAYNFFVFRYAESHMREIFLFAGLLYLIGFGVMCLKIREGEYPPPPDEGERVGWLAKIRLFSSQCFTSRYYWYIFLTYTFISMSGCIGVFGIFFLKSLGFTLAEMGKMGAVSAITVPVCLLFTGFIVDRYHPVRVAAYLGAYDAFFVLGNWVWLFIPAPPTVVFLWIIIVNGAVFRALLGATKDNAEMTRLMRLLPREKYGQFSGAMALVRAIAIMAGGLLAGLYLDLWRKVLPEGDFVYRLNFLFSAPLAIIAFTFHYLTYRAWKRLGGDTHYVPPDISLKISTLAPRSDGTTHVRWGLASITVWAVMGALLSNVVWIVYYTRYEPNPHHALIWIISLVTTAALYLVYLWFLKFMERR
jgi:hypothetical protein